MPRTNSRPAQIHPLKVAAFCPTCLSPSIRDLSHLTIDAKVHTDAGTVDLGTQGKGLDSAAFEGTLVAGITKRGVRFSGGSDIRAIEHEGKFDPGDDDAAYAIDGKLKKIITLAEVDAAVRDLSLDITRSDRKEIAGSQRRFLLRDAEIKVTSGTVDYDVDSKFGDADGSERSPVRRRTFRTGTAESPGPKDRGSSPYRSKWCIDASSKTASTARSNLRGRSSAEKR